LVLAFMAVLPVAVVVVLPSAGAAESVALPFVQGEAVLVIQGYNGGTHQGASIYGLDLVLVSGATSGAMVLSPFEGSIGYANEPGQPNGCVSVTARDGKFNSMMCHVLLDRPFPRGERVSRGQPLGTVGAPGTLGNNGSAHVHMELQRGSGSGNDVPFGSPDGLPLEDAYLPATGARGEHAGITIVSTNSISDPPPPTPTSTPRATSTPRVVATPTPTRRGGPAPVPTPTPTQTANRCATGAAPRYVFGFADLQGQLTGSMGEAVTCEFADPKGTGDVHQVTSKGLAFWRKSTNVPTFTNGYEHWGRTAQGWVYWLGESIDPPL
jgi:hypothetical protein